MGSVRAADDRDLHRGIAIKFLLAGDAQAAEQFVEEAQITSQLQHPNIVPVYDFGRDAQGLPWLAMKHIEGHSLADIITEWRGAKRCRLGADDYATILGIFSKVCDAVAFAHSRGVIHRDIKPHNVMVGSYGEVLLVDWGLARPIGNGAKNQQGSGLVRSVRRESGREQTLDGDVFGTPAYMSPEQAEGRVHEVDERSDIFCLGGVLYHMLTLCPPYEGRGASDTVARAARHLLLPPRRRAPAHGISRELQAIVLKAMAARPADRYSTVAEFQADLAAWQSSRPTKAWRPDVFTRLLKWTRRHPTMTAVVVLFVIAGLAVAALGSQLNASEAARLFAQESADRRAEQAKWATLERDRAESRAQNAERSVVDLNGRVRALLGERAEVLINLFQARFLEAQQRGVSITAFGESLSADERRTYLAAFDELFEACRKAGEKPTALQWYERGVIRHLTGDLAGAIADYDESIRLRPDSVESWINRAVAKSDVKDYDGARWDCDEAIRLSPGGLMPLHNAAQIALDRGDDDTALSYFGRMLDIEPANADALSGRAEILDRRGNPAAAIREYDRILQATPDNVRVLTNRGLARVRAGQLRGGLDDYDRALLLDPDCYQALVNRCYARCDSGELAGALQDANEALRLKPRESEAHYCRAHVESQAGDADSALRDVNAALSLDPAHILALTLRGRLRFAIGDFSGAHSDLDAALKLDPGNADALNGRCAALMELGDLQGALSDADALLELLTKTAHQNETARNKNRAQCLTNRAQVLMRMKRCDEAAADVEEALAATPGYSPAYVARALLNQWNGSVEAAMRDCSAALDGGLDAGQRATALGVRAWARRASGDAEGALSDYDDALRIRPDDVTMLCNRGSTRGALGDHDGAIRDLDAALRIKPDFGAVLVNRGLQWSAKGDLDRAAADFDRAVQVAPDLPEAWYSRGSMRQDRGDLEGANTDLEEAIRLRPRYVDALAARAASWLVAGNREAALELMRDAWRYCGDDRAAYRERLAALIKSLGGEVSEDDR